MVLSPGDMPILEGARKKIDDVCEDRDPIEWLFRAKFKPKKAISYELLQQRLNEILRYASEMFGKHLRTHSFRATRVTDCMSGRGVCADNVALLVGHKNSSTTKRYDRSNRDFYSVFEQMDRLRGIDDGEISRLAAITDAGPHEIDSVRFKEGSRNSVVRYSPKAPPVLGHPAAPTASPAPPDSLHKSFVGRSKLRKSACDELLLPSPEKNN